MKKAALIIGDHGGGDFRRLVGVGNDLNDMHAFLQMGCGYDIVFTVRDGSKAEILAALADMVGQLSPGDRLTIYFSGHGHAVRGEHVLICKGATRDMLDYFHEVIPVNQLRRATDRRGLDRSVIVDSCQDSPYVAGTRGGSTRMTAEQAQYLRDVGVAPIEPTATGITGSREVSGVGGNPLTSRVRSVRGSLCLLCVIAQGYLVLQKPTVSEVISIEPRDIRFAPGSGNPGYNFTICDNCVVCQSWNTER